MGKKIWLIILCICLSAMIGCGGEAEQAESNELTEYYENSQVFRLPGEHYPFTLMGMSNTYFYYYHNEIVSNEEEYTENIVFYRQALEKGSEPVRLELPTDNPLVRTSCIFTDSEGKDSIYLLLLDSETDGKLSYCLAGFDTEGMPLERIFLKSTGGYRDYANAFLKLQNGNFAVITRKYFFVADTNGETLASIPCPGEEYRGIVELSDGRVGVSYVEENSNNVHLAIADQDAKSLSGGTAITGDGNLLCLSQEGIAYVDEEGIHQYDLTAGTTRNVVGLKGRNIDLHQIVNMQATGDSFFLLGRSADMTAVKYITYAAKQEEASATGEEEPGLDPEKYDAYGRRYLYLYDFSGEWPHDSTDPIDAFNEQSDSYQVVMMDYQYGDTYGYDVAKIVASGDYPDLIFSKYNSLIAAFQEKGILEDLTPYIDNSPNLSLEDLSKPIMAAYTDQDKLFALPNCYYLDALWGDRAQLGESGWTVDELLDWLASYPKAGAPNVYSRKNIYDACIPAVLDMCIDRETGKASFDGEIFESFITKMKALNRTGKEYPSYEEAKQLWEEMKGSEYCLKTIVYLSTIASAEYEQGREMVIKGYPSADGEPLAYVMSSALSILSTSEAKEGAYEFLEFYLLYMNDNIVELMQYGVGSLWTVNQYLEQNKEAVLKADPDKGAFNTFSERQLDEVMNIIPYAVLKDYSQDDLKELIWEELTPFFEDQKTADAVSSIIQSRVQVYLDENGI